MATTLSSLRTRLRTRVGNPSTTALPNASADSYINLGYHWCLDTYLHTVNRQEYTFTTVAGTSTYSIPRSYRSLMRLWDYTNGTRIHKLTHTRLFDFRANSSSTVTGQPKWYYKSGTELMLLPTPNSAYSIKALCKLKLDDLEDDADEVEIDDWDDIILARAMYMYYLDIGDEPKAKWALAVLTEAVSSKPTQLEEEQVDQEIPFTGKDYYPSFSPFRRRMSTNPWGE